MVAKISLGSLGGTISMIKSNEDAGVVPKLTADDFLSSLSGLLGVTEVSAKSLFALPSTHLIFEHIVEVLAWAESEIQNGSNGIVLTQGTDTLEETAFLLDLLWKYDNPLIITGAMRSAEDVGADGMANLRAAVIAASSEKSFGRGVQVVINDDIFEARWVQKLHTSAVQAFSSSIGPAGCVKEGQCWYFKAPLKRMVFEQPELWSKEVCLWQSSLADKAIILKKIFDTRVYQGLVVSAFGAGHVSKEMSLLISDLAEQVPVIVCSRTLCGRTAMSTYGWQGAEIDLQSKGVIMGEWLSPLKARLLLSVLLNTNKDIKYYQQYTRIMVY